MKKLLMLGLVLLTIFGISISAQAIDQNRIDLLIQGMQTDSIKILGENHYDISTEDGIKVIALGSREQISKLENWRFNNHFIYLSVDSYGNTKLTIRVKEYQDCSSPDSYTCVDWVLVDIGSNGIIDDSLRDFEVFMQNYQKIEDYNIKIFITYPKGFVNVEWYNPSKEEIQAYFDKEIEYWINRLNL